MPAADRIRSVRILQLTDCHFPGAPGQTVQGVDTQRTFSALAHAILGSGVHYDLMLLTGDLAEEAGAYAYGLLREQLGRFRIPCYCLPGNHDEIGAMRQFLAGDAVRMESRIVLDHWQIICLDSTIPGESGGFLADSQLVLLEDALTREPDKSVLVAVHHHPVPCGSDWMDTMMIRNGDRLFGLLEGFAPRVRGMVFGHIHQDFDQTIQGIRVLGTPSTCCQFKPRSASFCLDTLRPGYRWLELHDAGRLLTGVEYL